MNPAISDAVDYRSKALQTLGQLPTFSPILNQLLRELERSDVSLKQAAGLVERDAVLAGNVLRLANSAFYGRRGTVSSVGLGISLIGLTKLKNVAITLSIARLWTGARTPASWPSKRFNVHSVATAVMADLLVQRVPVHYPEGAFVAGLLHDIGLLILAVSAPNRFSEVRRLHCESGLPIEQAEQSLMDLDHAELSAAAVHKWNLPEPIQKAVRYQFLGERRSGMDVPLSWIIRAASAAVETEGLAIFDCSAPAGRSIEDILKDLDPALDPQRLLSDCRREFEALGEIVSSSLN